MSLLLFIHYFPFLFTIRMFVFKLGAHLIGYKSQWNDKQWIPIEKKDTYSKR
jgi:hypothetical protein